MYTIAGCHPNLRCNFDKLTKQFKWMDINGLIKEKNRVAVVPYFSGYSKRNENENANAIVPFQDMGV